MLLFDPEKNEENALEIYENLIKGKDDTLELREHFINVFNQVSDHRDICLEMAELALGDGGDDTGNFSQISDN